MFKQDQTAPSAILFFRDNAIAKELLYTEFEAHLDGFTPEKDWANMEVQAVYVELDEALCLTAAVFFLVSFDDEGWVEASWNLPLVNLVRMGGFGPDFGAGEIQLCCNSLCTEARYREMLWEPDLSPQGPHFQAIVKTANANRLGFSRVKKTPTQAQAAITPQVIPQVAPQQVVQAGVAPLQGDAMAQYMSEFVKAQSGAADAIQEKYQAELEELKQDYEEKAKLLQGQLKESLQSLSNATATNKNLRDSLNQQEKKLKGVREYYQLKIENTPPEEAGLVKSIKEHYQRELENKIQTVEKEFAEIINWRDTEIANRSDKEASLQHELDELRTEYQSLLDKGVMPFLEKLAHLGMSFMLYRDVIGYVTIPIDDLASYADNPDAYVAQLCGVSEATYQDWLTHYRAPVCQAENEDGSICQEDVPLISDPTQYIVGVSDRCDRCQGR